MILVLQDLTENLLLIVTVLIIIIKMVVIIVPNVMPNVVNVLHLQVIVQNVKVIIEKQHFLYVNVKKVIMMMEQTLIVLNVK